MDILTHALIGGASAAGCLPSQPELACGLIFGNVLPDLDAFSRLAGKRAFVRCHQTYTHSVAGVAIVLLLSVGLLASGQLAWSRFVAGLAMGMVMHIGLDLTNSYGVQWAWPLSHRRVAFDWIFFIDLPTLLFTSLALLLVGWFAGNAAVLPWISGIYITVLLAHVAARAGLARRVQRIAQQNDPAAIRIAVIPTTWLPWRFLVCRDHGSTCVTLAFSAIGQQESEKQTVEILDSRLPLSVCELPEWQAMRELSPHYHAVEYSQSGDEATIVGRDLRIRNFDTRFGKLTCQLDATGQVIAKQWEV